MAFNYSPKIVTDGLVLYLDAANIKSYIGTGTTWSDLSRNQNNGTLVNGPTFSSQNGGSIVFDGVNDYVECVNSPSLLITSDLTINIWYFNTAPEDGLGLVTKGPLINDYDYMLYLTTNSTGMNFYKKDNLGNAETRGGFTSNFLNRWVNICFTKQGTTVTSYENAVIRATGNFTNSEIRTSTNTLKIGSGWSNRFNGNIPIIQMYNRAITHQEVLQNYNATKSRFGL